MNELPIIRVLLVEDDEDDYLIARDLFSEIKGRKFEIEWVQTFESGLKAMARNNQDICLVDYRLGAHNGLELMRAAKSIGAEAPVILMTGLGQEEVDLAAMKAGAADYLVKGQVEARHLERAIRYAIERKRAASQAAFEQARLASFGTQIGLALARGAALDAILENCASAMVQYLNGALVQFWIFDAGTKTFIPRAQAGPLFTAEGSAQNLPVFSLDFQEVAEGRPVFFPALLGEQRFEHQAWACLEKIASLVVYPLVLEEHVVGAVSLFTHEPLAPTVIQEISSVANGIAMCIQHKQAAEALDASESRYHSVVENIKEVIFQTNEFGHWSFLNPAWTAITGFAVKATFGKSFLESLHPDDRERGRTAFVQLVNREIGHACFETRLLTKSGDVRWVELYLQLTLDEAGAVLGASGSLNDITERKLAEAQAQKLAAFPRVNPNPVLEFAADGTLSYANDAARELVNALGKQQVSEILPPGATAIVGECLARGTKRLAEEVRIDDHTITWSFFPVSASRVVHCYGTDITEMLSLEAQFRHAQKLESVGQLAAGIAHDFNNILTVIQGYSECLIARVNGDDSLSRPLKQIAGASRRATTLTRQLLMFSRKQVLQARVFNLNSVLDGLADMLPRLLGDDIALESAYAESLPAIEADAGMIEQVVMNLAVNARDAMPKGGRLLLTTSLSVITDDYVRQRPDARAGRFICLSVADSGCGMDAKTLAHMFEPFFSTKAPGHGTGLGLATVYGIVKQHQGWVEVVSEVGAGTTFRIFFPTVNTAAGDLEAQNATPPAVRGCQETILLVEDEPVLREMVVKVLKEYDYRVLEAASGVQALKVWDQHKGQIDLVLTDMVMPEGMTGSELAAELRKRKPEVKVLFSSGYSSEIMGRNFREDDTVFLQKPYGPPQLTRCVRRCLDAVPKSETELVPA